MILDSLRLEIESFLRELEEEEYQQRAGLSARSQVARIYDRYERLWQPTRVEQVRTVTAAGASTHGPRLRRPHRGPPAGDPGGSAQRGVG